MTTVTGLVTEVITEPTASSLTLARVATDTLLYVESVAGFPDAGTIRVTDHTVNSDEVTEVVAYDQVDQEANTLSLTGPLVNAYTAGAEVVLTDPSRPTTTAFVSTSADQDPIGAVVPQELVAVHALALVDGMRNPGEGVAVTVAERYGRWEVVTVQSPPSVPSNILSGPVPEDLLPPIPTLSDGDAPVNTPAIPAGRSIPGFAQITWDTPTNADVIIGYRVYVGTDPAMPANATTFHSIAGGTMALIRTLPDGSPMTPGTVYWFRVAAEDYDGVGPATAAVSATIGQQSTPDIETGAVTASMLQSVLVLASQFVGKDPPLVVTNKQLTSNVATLTTELAHGLEVGSKVLVTGVDATFNGLQTVTAVPTTTTFSYAKTAANVASTPVVGGLADPSQRWEADSDGIRFYDKAGVPVIVLPTNASPQNPASFYGSLVAVGLIVLDNLSVSGLNNELAAGSNLTMKSGVTKPSLAPILSATYPDGVTFQYDGYDIRTAIRAVDFDGTNWWVIRHQQGDTTAFLDKFAASGGAPIQTTTLTRASGSVNTITVLKVIGTWIFAGNNSQMERWDITAPTAPFKFIQPGEGTPTLARPDGATDFSGGTYYGRFDNVGVDRVNGRLTYTFKNASGQLGWRTYNPSTLAVVDTFQTTYAADSNSGIHCVGRAVLDLGDRWFYYTEYSSAVVDIFSIAATPVVQTNEQFPSISTSGTAKHIVWDGTRFVQFGATYPEYGSTTPRVRNYSQLRWTTESSKWWGGTTWRKADATGPDFAEYETEIGPLASLTMKKRAYLTVSHPNGPTAPADALTFYLARSATTPVNADLERQTQPAAGITSKEYDTVTFGGTGEPPTTNTFPGGTPAKIQAQAGGFNVNSESTGAWHKKAATPRFVGRMTAATQTIGHATTTLVTGVQTDTDNSYDGGSDDHWSWSDTNDQLTILKAGWWDLYAVARWAAVNPAQSSGSRTVYIFKNGTAIAEMGVPGSASTTANSTPSLSLTEKLAVNDVIDIRVRHNAGAGVNLDIAGGSPQWGTRLHAIYAGPAEA